MKTLLPLQYRSGALKVARMLGIQACLAILFASIAYATPILSPQAQALTVTGTVEDANGQTIPGVNVIERGTTNGTTTDFEGKFTINLQNENSVLVFSFIGVGFSFFRLDFYTK